VYFERLLYSKILHPFRGRALRVFWRALCFLKGHFLFFGGYYDFFIFLVKDILISFQRYNDFSDNSVLYYLLHFLTSPCTIRLEEKKISGKDNSLHSVKPSFSGICRKRASPRLPPQGALISVMPSSWGFTLLIMLFLKAESFSSEHSLFSNLEKNIYVLILMYEKMQFVESSFCLLFLE